MSEAIAGEMPDARVRAASRAFAKHAHGDGADQQDADDYTPGISAALRAAGVAIGAPYPQVEIFAERMRAELIANADKGDRWQNMTVRQAWGEISWHVGKLTGAIKSGDIPAIRELAADIANGALMLDEIVSQEGTPS